RLDYHQAVQFYRHEMDWSNRLILGDSLQVMASLAQREHLAGKVQMIYVDPPYGIRFGSNFQPKITSKNVKDKEKDLTREAEMVRAYRDTWTLGRHSYLAYLRDRLTLARDLLTDSGSLFLQIGDENVHLVRDLMDEIFGAQNYVATINYQKTSHATSDYLPTVFDQILFFAKNKDQLKFKALYFERNFDDSPR